MINNDKEMKKNRLICNEEIKKIQTTPFSQITDMRSSTPE